MDKSKNDRIFIWNSDKIQKLRNCVFAFLHLIIYVMSSNDEETKSMVM